MKAVLLSTGEVHRPFYVRRNLTPQQGGCGCDPDVRVVVWQNQTDYATDLANGNMNQGYFDTFSCPGLALADSEDQQAICNAMITSGDIYAGATVI